MCAKHALSCIYVIIYRKWGHSVLCYRFFSKGQNQCMKLPAKVLPCMNSAPCCHHREVPPVCCSEVLRSPTRLWSCCPLPISKTHVSQRASKQQPTSITTTTKTLLISTVLLSVAYCPRFVLTNQYFWINILFFWVSLHIPTLFYSVNFYDFF